MNSVITAMFQDLLQSVIGKWVKTHKRDSSPNLAPLEVYNIFFEFNPRKIIIFTHTTQSKTYFTTTQVHTHIHLSTFSLKIIFYKFNCLSIYFIPIFSTLNYFFFTGTLSPGRIVSVVVSHNCGIILT